MKTNPQLEKLERTWRTERKAAQLASHEANRLTAEAQHLGDLAPAELHAQAAASHDAASEAYRQAAGAARAYNEAAIGEYNAALATGDPSARHKAAYRVRPDAEARHLQEAAEHEKWAEHHRGAGA